MHQKIKNNASSISRCVQRKIFGISRLEVNHDANQTYGFCSLTEYHDMACMGWGVGINYIMLVLLI